MELAGYSIRVQVGAHNKELKMRTATVVLMMLAFLAVSACGSGSSRSTRVGVGDDTKGPQRTAGYAGDAKEVSAHMLQQLKRQQVIENYKAKWNNEPPIVFMVRPVNNTRFVEMAQFFVEDLVSEFFEGFTREDLRFTDRSTQTLAEIEAEKAAKEAGEVTDRSGRRTRLGADFIITARFDALSATDGRQDDDTIKYTYQFVDAETSEVMFRSSYDIRRVSSKAAAYR